jgi:hypothetical protein
MIKKSLSLVLLPLLFTACMERGQSLKPKKVELLPMTITLKTAMKKTVNHVKKQKIEHRLDMPKLDTSKSDTPKEEIVHKTTPLQKPDKTIDSNKTSTTKNMEFQNIVAEDTNSIFALSDETKNNISGFFIFVIGLVIFL